MLSTYRLPADELSSTLVQAIKKAYQHKQIEITVQAVEDETEYLLKSQANREHLTKSIGELGNQSGLVSMSPESLRA